MTVGDDATTRPVVPLDRANTILYCRRWEATVAFYRDPLRLPVTHHTDWFVEFRLTDGAYLSVADASRGRRLPDLRELPTLWVRSRDLNGLIGLQMRRNLLLRRNRLLKQTTDYLIALPLALVGAVVHMMVGAAFGLVFALGASRLGLRDAVSVAQHRGSVMIPVFAPAAFEARAAAFAAAGRTPVQWRGGAPRWGRRRPVEAGRGDVRDADAVYDDLVHGRSAARRRCAARGGRGCRRRP